MGRRTSRVVSGLAAVAAAAAMISATATPASAWLAGETTRYPAEGGTWQYGFWNAYARSYYTVNKCHGSSVKVNGTLVRSIDTAAGKKSIAEKFAVNYWGAEDAYYYRTC